MQNHQHSGKWTLGDSGGELHFVRKLELPHGSECVLKFFIKYCFFKGFQKKSTCGNPADYGLHMNYEEIASMTVNMNYGMTRFSNIFWSLMSMFQFITAIGWSSIIYSVIGIFFFILFLLMFFKFCVDFVLSVCS